MKGEKRKAKGGRREAANIPQKMHDAAAGYQPQRTGYYTGQ